MAIRKILLKNKGFVLPLVLVILLVISFMSLWCNKDLLLNIYSTVSQREFNQFRCFRIWNKVDNY